MPRPSSPLNAKASVRSPYALDRSQQNSCVGTDAGRGTKPGQRPHMRFVFQTMMSSRIHPPTPGGADEPFNSRCQMSHVYKETQPTRCFPRSRGMPSTRAWWSQTGSNRRPHACKARALPTELWPLEEAGLSESRRSILLPARGFTRSVVGPGRLELPTSRLSGVCSNQLSYRPLKRSAQRGRPART